MEHDLVVIYKAFGGDADPALAEARQVFAGVAHAGLIVPDIGFDLGSYALTAQQIHSPFVCCVNTYSEPLSDGWLRKLYHHAAQPEVGVAGASCSYESIASSVILLSKATHYQATYPWHGNSAVHDYFGQPLGQAPPKSRCRQAMWRWTGRLLHRWQRRLPPSAVDWDTWLASWLRAQKGLFDDFARFPPFPNPHVRSNAFVMRRQRLLWWVDPLPVNKTTCLELECGPNSLTRRLSREGLAAVAVGRDGERYPLERFPESGVFRSGNQENLLVADNRTREFLAMAPKMQTLYSRMTWGDYLLPEPADFPAFDSPFRKDSALLEGRTDHGRPAFAPEPRHLKEAA